MKFKSILASLVNPFTLLLSLPSLVAFIFTKLLSSSASRNQQVQPGLNIIIFSKDRPLQILSLLDSFYYYNTDKNIDNISTIYVIFKCSQSSFLSGYNSVISKFSGYNIKWINQGKLPLKSCLLSLPIYRRLYTTTLVDDIIFRYPFSLFTLFSVLDNRSLFYLRLGSEIKNSLMQANNEYFQPRFKQISRNHIVFLTWKHYFINNYKSEWFYLLTLDGLVCNTF